MRQRFHIFKKQQGTALLSALLITALAAVLAAEVASQQSLLINQATWSRGAAHAAMAIQYAKQQAIEQIFIAATKSPDHLIHKVNSQPQNLGTLYGAQVEMSLTDAQTKWNINALSETTDNISTDKTYAMNDLTALLMQVTASNNSQSDLLPISQLNFAQAQKLTQYIRNYVGPYREDAADRYYMKHQPPYYPAHQMMMHYTQMRSIEGINRAMYQRLNQVITALPTTQNKININDLPDRGGAIAAALGVPSYEISAWNDCRISIGRVVTNNDMLKKYLGFCTSISDSISYAGKQNQPIESRLATPQADGQTQLTTSTNYIFLNIKAKIGLQRLGLHSLIYVSKLDNNIIIKEIWEDGNINDNP